MSTKHRENPLKKYVKTDDIIGVVCGPNNADTIRFRVSAEHPGLVRGTIITAPINRGPNLEPRFLLGEVIELTRHANRDMTGECVVLGRYEFRDETPVTIHYDGVPPAHPELFLFLAPPDLLQACLAGLDITFPGYLLGPQQLLAPVRLPHFGPVDEGGIGEGWHGGIFGPTGSGKTIALATILALWSRHPSMGMLILDPQGQFRHDTFAEKTNLPFHFHHLLKQYRRQRFDPAKHCLTLDQLRLEGFPMFIDQLIANRWFITLGLKPGQIPEAKSLALTFFETLQQQHPQWSPAMTWAETCLLRLKFDPSGLHPESHPIPFYDALAETLANVETTGRSGKLKDEIQDRIASPLRSLHIEKAWERASQPFRPFAQNGEKRASLSTVLKLVLFEGATAIIDVGQGSVKNQIPGEDDEQFRFRLIHACLWLLNDLAKHNYQPGGRNANCLLVLDEAADLAPNHAKNPAQLALSNFLVENVLRVRKYGIGIIFATQNIVGFRTNLFRNLTWRCYGLGLGVGTDGKYITEREGKHGLDIYRSIPDPRTTKTYGIMLGGPIQTLSSRHPMLMTVTAHDDILLTRNPPLGTHRPLARRIRRADPAVTIPPDPKAAQEPPSAADVSG